MKPRKTCLILGAGASKPYGFALGRDLKTLILKYCASKPTDCAPDEVEKTWGVLEHFARKFEEDSSETIDQFLLTLPDGEEERELREHGKMALARVLGNDEIPVNNPRDRYRDWYEDAFRCADLLSQAGEKLRVVTFNYERSFEYYGSLAAQECLGGSVQDSRSRFQDQIEIAHVYGQLLPLPWIIDGSSRDDPVAEYGDIAGWPAWKAREKMRTVNLGTPCPATRDRCCRWIREAEYILVLGFGYDDSNLKHIGLDRVDAGKFIFSSGFKLEEKCRNRVRSSIPPTVHFAGEHVDIATFLRTSELLDSAAKGKPAEHVFKML